MFSLAIFLSIAVLVIAVVLFIAKIEGSDFCVTVAMAMILVALFVTAVSWGEYFTK